MPSTRWAYWAERGERPFANIPLVIAWTSAGLTASRRFRPWTVTITLRSGLVERSASAQILFPSEAGTSGRPVQATLTAERGRRLPYLPLAVGLVVLVAVFLVILGRRRRHRDDKDQ